MNLLQNQKSFFFFPLFFLAVQKLKSDVGAARRECGTIFYFSSYVESTVRFCYFFKTQAKAAKMLKIIEIVKKKQYNNSVSVEGFVILLQACLIGLNPNSPMLFGSAVPMENVVDLS